MATRKTVKSKSLKKEARTDFIKGSKVYEGDIKRLSHGFPTWSIKQGLNPSFTSETPMSLEKLHEKYPGSVIKALKR